MQNTAEHAAPHTSNATPSRDQDALQAIQNIYKDGVVDRDEAEQMFLLQAKLDETDAPWVARFRQAIRDHVLLNAAPPNWVRESEADWLIARIEAHERPDSWLLMDTVIDILRRADGVDPRLVDFLLTRLAARCIADGRVGADEVERLRFALFAAAGSGGLWVSEVEADLLFAINDATAKADNDPSWNDLFARLIANYIMARECPEPRSVEAALSRETWLNDSEFSFQRFVANFTGFGGKKYWTKLLYDPKRERQAYYARAEAANARAEKVTRFESAYVNSKIRDDDFVSPAEQALLDFLAVEAPDFVAP